MDHFEVAKGPGFLAIGGAFQDKADGINAVYPHDAIAVHVEDTGELRCVIALIHV